MEDFKFTEVEFDEKLYQKNIKESDFNQEETDNREEGEEQCKIQN